MSKKRFELANFSADIIGIKDNEYDAFILDKDVVGLLNELIEVNEQLNLTIEDLLTHTSCEEVKKENSDLRQNIKIIKDLLSECDLFSDKATEHDIIAYRELHKFDNKDAYSIACAIAKIKKVIDDE